MIPSVTIEHRGCATVAWQQGPRHKFYEGRFRLLCRPIPLVEQASCSEIFAVLDGVASAPKGMAAAQEVCDGLVKFFDRTGSKPSDQDLLQSLLMQANSTIVGWGMIDGSDRPDGACAGTVIWIDCLLVAHVFHAGDTAALLIRGGVAKALTSVHHSGDGHLSNYFGLPSLRLDIQTTQLEEGDRMLAFSDGIGKAFFANQQVADIVETQPTRQASLSALFASARASGSSDDATAILFDVEDPE
jgi:serine/threonine protein phosphatase PrpC